MKHSLLGGSSVSAFAHLLGLGPRASAVRAEDDDTDRKEDARAEVGDDDEETDEKKDSKKSKKAKADVEPDDEDGDEEASAAAEDDEADDKQTKKSKKAKADDDDEECEDGEDDDYAKGRKAERARWAKVLKSPAAAGGRVAAACEMLAGTSMSAKAVIATLGALPGATGRTGLQDRMSAAKIPNVGSGAASGDKPGLAAQIVAAGKKRRGESV